MNTTLYSTCNNPFEYKHSSFKTLEFPFLGRKARIRSLPIARSAQSGSAVAGVGAASLVGMQAGAEPRRPSGKHYPIWSLTPPPETRQKEKVIH